MLNEHKLGAGLPTFGSCADRFCSSYGKGGASLEEMLALAVEVKELDGLELIGNVHINDRNAARVKQLFAECNFEVSMIVCNLFTSEKWGSGSIASPSAQTRKEAIAEVKRTMDWAAEVNCRYVDLWPGQDGYDYPFQANYLDGWRWLKEGIQECAAYRSDVKVLVEYKLKEPRTHCYVGNAPKTALLLQGMSNAGCVLDVGHSIAGGENIAEAAALLSEYGMLDYFHLNDNYRSWDDDMMVASINIPEALEFVYWIKKLKYGGWLSLDIFPYREDSIPAAKNCIEWLKVLFAAVERMGMTKIENVINSGNANDSCRIVREMLFPGA
jgi:xylose isomerase